jgi:hypothetical protein
MGWPAVKLSREGVLADGEYLRTFAPCSTDTRDTPQCQYVSEFAEFMTYDATLQTTEPFRKLEVLIEDTNGRVLDSIGYFYDEPGRYNINQQFAMVFGSSTNAVYVIRSCLLQDEDFAIFGAGECTTMVYGNGTTTEGYLAWWEERNPNTPNAGLTAYETLQCGDIGITEVGKAFRCALLWAFEPSTASVEKFRTSMNLVQYSYPIGYVSHMFSQIQDTMSATSTDIFTREIELGKYFGKPNTATTTLSLDGMDTYTNKIKPVTDKIDMLLWIGFSAWFIVWAISRRL